MARPALVPVPAFALELLYGEMARATILAGQRVLPRSLVANGFEFQQPTLEGALRAELSTATVNREP
jgi:NAD dependent epimerase/dehydratase family enzyme